MNAVALTEKLFTVAEYIEFEEQSEIRHEFHFGRLLPMAAGTSKNHNRVKQNVVYALRSHFSQQGCVVFDENLKLQILENEKYNYPDVMLSCDTQDNDSEFIVKTPILIVEILSKSTARYDKTDKFEDFQKVPSIQYYLLVESRWQSVSLYSRTDNPLLWTYQIFKEPTDIVSFPKLNFELSLQTIYQYIDVPQFASIPNVGDENDED